ncbi:MAG: YncE family protein, partial [bacterium]|nr:YncE family protein [bacterium]
MKTKNYFARRGVVNYFMGCLAVCCLFFYLFAYPAYDEVYAQNAYAYVANTNSNTVSAIDLSTNTVEATIVVEQNPFGVACSPDGRYVYVTNGRSNSVSVINTATNTVETTIAVGNGPVEMVFSIDSQFLYVTHAFSNDVYIIDTNTNTVLDTISTFLDDSDTSSGIDITPDGNYLYVVNSDSSVSGVIVVDLANNTAIEEIVVGDGATGISIDTSGTKAYVCNAFDNTISVLDLTTNTVIKTLDQSDGVELAPSFVNITPDNQAWVTFALSNTIGIFDVNTDELVRTFPVDQGPTGLAFSPGQQFVYVTNALSNTVLAISTDDYTTAATIPVDQAPRGIDICIVPPLPVPCQFTAYVANTNSNTVSVIDLSTNTVEATIAVEDYPFGVAGRFDGRYVYVTNGKSNSVSVINTATNIIETTIPVGEGPVEMAFSTDGNFLFVTNAFSEDVYVIDTKTQTVIATIDVDLGGSDTPSGIDRTPDGEYLYVVNSDTTTSGVIVIELATNNAIEEITVGNGATGISINPSGTKAYVCNSFDNTISVLDLTTNTVIKTLDQSDGVELAPTFVEITPDNQAWVTFTLSNKVGIFDVDTDELVTTFPVDQAPTGLAFSPCRDFAYVTNALSNTVWAVSTTGHFPVAIIEVDQAPRGIDIITIPKEVPAIYDIFVVGEERTDNVSKLEAHGHNVNYGGDNLNVLAATNLSEYDQVWISSFQDVADSAATASLINFIKNGGRAFFMGENIGGDRPERVKFANWRDSLLNVLGAGGVKQSPTLNPTQQTYYTNRDHVTSYQPNCVCEIFHCSVGNGTFENIGNGTPILTTLPDGGLPVALALDYAEMSAAPQSRVIVYLNSNNDKGYDHFIANIAEFLGANETFGTHLISAVDETKSKDDLLPNEFKLMQNYPNPFNPTTLIEYQIPQSARVVITIYNTLGQKI